MGKFQDLTGMKFGKLTVVGRDKPFVLKVVERQSCGSANVSVEMNVRFQLQV